MSWYEEEPSDAQLELLKALGHDEFVYSMGEASELIENLLEAETKAERIQRYRKRAMERKPPSTKQLSLLGILGVRAVPSSMWQASKWINEILEAME